MEELGPMFDASPTGSPIDKTGGGFGQMDNMQMDNMRNNFSGRPNFNPGRFGNGMMGNTTQAPVLLGLGGTLLFISICLLAARLWSRARPSYRLKHDDWTVLAATVLAIVQYFLLSVSVIHGLGRRARFVSFRRRRIALQLLFISQLFWYWSITLVKLSFALLLLRLKHTKRWRFFLYAVMGLTVAAAIVQTCFQFLQCRPFSVYWDPRVFRQVEVKCFKRSVINGNIVAFSGVQVGLDLIFSFIPITFIRKLNRPRREKIFMCILMALGLVASCAAIARTMTLQGFYTSRDSFRSNVTIALWAVLEQQFALIAATIPTLKAFMEKTLVRIGLFFYDEGTEQEVRGHLVRFGLLEKEDMLAKGEVVERIPTTAQSATVRTPNSSKKTYDEFGDTVDLELDIEKDVSFEEMFMKSAKAKEFV